jgi:FAD/FMN-containing dehydrogenase
VVAAVGFARDMGLVVSVRGGGHSVAGYGVWDDALMIDLSPMKAVQVHTGHRTAAAQPGLTWGEFDAATQEYGLATTGADTSTVGIAGMTLGGGLGWLQRIYGLTCDNLLSAEVVLADGCVLRAAEDENRDLFWALRGGGGNFGVVTSFEYRLHPISEAIGGIVIHPLGQAHDVLCFYQDLCRSAPEELMLTALLVTAPPARSMPEDLRGRPVVVLGVAYFGPVAEGQQVVRPLREFGPPAVDLIRPVRYVDLQESPSPSGLRHYGKGEFLRELDEVVIRAVIAGVTEAVSPFTMVELNQLGGAISRVSEAETSFAYRHAAHSIGIHCLWPPADAPDRHVAWVQTLWEAVQTCSAGGAYVNHLGEEGDGRVRAAYGAETYERLAAIKAKYDSDNFFRVNQNIKPRGGKVD